MLLWRTHYRCANPRCKHTDYVDVFDGEKAPLAINCARCHAGFNIEVRDMLRTHTGMFPVSAATKYDTKGDLGPVAKVVSISSSNQG